MDNPFFTALEVNGGDAAAALAQQTNNVLIPFRHYLNNSIEALKNKEVSCFWAPVANQQYRITPQQRIWNVEPYTEIELLNEQAGWYQIISVDDGLPDDEFDPDEADPILQGKGKGRKEYKLVNYGYKKSPEFYIYLPDMLLNQEPVSWSGYQLELKPLEIELDKLNSVHVDSQPCKVISQSKGKLKIQGHVKKSSELSVEGKKQDFSILKSFDESYLQSYSTSEYKQGWLVFSQEKPQVNTCQLENVTQALFTELTASHFTIEGKPLEADSWSISTDKNSITLESKSEGQGTEPCSIFCQAYPEVQWDITPIKNKEKWVQLIEKDGKDDTGKSDLDYFFEDNQNSKILDSTQGKFDDGFRILKTKPEDRQILLVRNLRGKRNHTSEYPNFNGKSRELRVSVDTSQLQRQKEALNQIMCRPAREHWPLIQLLQDPNQIQWSDVEAIPEQWIDWEILSNLDFDGCDKQREFVAKALGSKDFTILDGPPGTGKTTTILELIFQLVSKGKRVLLSASTHAAINNVLERVKENEALSKIIHPLRVGDENNATGVEEFQLDNLLSQYKSLSGGLSVGKQLVVDSANLVCGTTIGILRLFNDKDITLDLGEPPFDVMIIDECSKTTFQEFLVPARFAKQWVLVGDVRQLSPFTDREQIVANLDNLMITPPKGKEKAKNLSTEVQTACFLLEELRGVVDRNDKPYSQAMIVPVSTGVLKALQQEIDVRKEVVEINAGLDSVLVVQENKRVKNK